MPRLSIAGANRYRRELFFAAGLLFGLFFYLINPFGSHPEANLVLAVSFSMILWWITEALPLAVVALMPLVLFPLFQISPLKNVVKSYADSTIFLFMGGFFIALAIEKWSLHKRIALEVIKLTGTNGDRIILGFIIATGFLSLWLSNTATTMMMFPIAMSVIHVIGSQADEGSSIKNFSVVLMLSIAYASNFAVGTIIGTPPNVAYAAHINEKFNYMIGFSDWMIVFMPMTILLLFMLYWVTVKWMYPNRIKKTEAGRAFIFDELQKLGKLSVPEKRVLWIFGVTVFLWITKDLLNGMQKTVSFDDTMIAMFGGILLFVIPSGKREGNRLIHLLEWQDTTKMAWGILLLFGGGIALAKALEEVKLMDRLGEYIASYASSNVFIMILVVSTISVFLSEVMSNIAMVLVLAPVISSVALALNMDPLLLGIPMTLGASCASMLPMGTPPNAIVFASNKIKIMDMIKTGFVLNIVSIVLITLFVYFLQPYFIKLL
jgi:sodium-dependent dicarboxylate transporter 2/3/5